MKEKHCWGGCCPGARVGALPLASTCPAEQTLAAGISLWQLKGKFCIFAEYYDEKQYNLKGLYMVVSCFKYRKSQEQSVLIKLSKIYAIVFDHEIYTQKTWGDVSLLKMLLANFSFQITDRVLHNHLFLSAYKFYLSIYVTSFSFKCQKNQLAWLDGKFNIYSLNAFHQNFWYLFMWLSWQGKL